jgi:threonine aldolase
MRFLGAQMNAYLQDDLWLENARHANAMARRLSQGLMGIRGVEFQAPVVTNMFFVKMAPALIVGLQLRGFDFYHGGRWEEGVARLVTSFQTRPEEVDAFLQAAQEVGE